MLSISDIYSITDKVKLHDNCVILVFFDNAVSTILKGKNQSHNIHGLTPEDGITEGNDRQS